MSDNKFKDYNHRGSRGFIAQLKTYGPFRSDQGLILGVARGIAEYFGWSIAIVRLILILVSIFMFFWPTIIIYLVAALIMSPAPTKNLNTQEERNIWFQTQMDPKSAMDFLAKRAASVEKRMQRLENYITSKEYFWKKRMND